MKKEITQAEARDFTLRYWKVVRESGITSKMDMSNVDLALSIEASQYYNNCALCELFLVPTLSNEPIWRKRCGGCPLKEAGMQCGTTYYQHTRAYDKWMDRNNYQTLRMEGAQDIIDVVEAWEPKEGTDE